MSAHDIHAGHDDHHDHDDLHVSMGDYVKGFILAVILTAIPFYLVMNGVITDRTTAVAVLGLFAIAQVLVHMVYFLHMNGKIQGGWTMLSTIFTVIFLAIAISGTLWVMFHMNAHMMPGHDMPAAASHADHAGHTAPATVTP
ncbi:cytochrome o ubiquinol oxidase subunit IV [Comamonas sp. Y33R10-2]|uniref:cytochrome o ubiquinol oxidase subunit IV n=1 Tax=Comamonas sp. Y33R10-2 TaxID=2853257 RepID=UPI001C5CC33E|nr:cytochrome o ubiquinol oxidase subunit IV [Comamonas sp. Y33R10-2]QXZ11090.1 cytochrome o ubiquinol oxidase subunit IV [Comamonas sp. Y33R10-2]